MANFTALQSLNGLQTFTICTVPYAGTFFVDGRLQIPTAVGNNQSGGGNGGSSVVAVVKKNGSASYTGAAGQTGFQCTITCAAADVLSVQLSSSAAVDQVYNAVTGTVGVSDAI